jgi:hypothetical protein
MLPNEETLLGVQERRITREMAGQDASCAGCTRLESYFTHKRPYPKGHPKYGQCFMSIPRYRVHPDLPRKLLCRLCFAHVKQHKVLPSEDDVRQILAGQFVSHARATGTDLSCSNCAAVGGSPECGGTHNWNSAAKAILCQACDRYSATLGEMRNPSLQSAHALRREMDLRRQQGLPVHCHKCNKVEPPRTGKVRKWRNREGLGSICDTCRHAGYAAKKKAGRLLEE